MWKEKKTVFQIHRHPFFLSCLHSNQAQSHKSVHHFTFYFPTSLKCLSFFFFLKLVFSLKLRKSAKPLVQNSNFNLLIKFHLPTPSSPIISDHAKGFLIIQLGTLMHSQFYVSPLHQMVFKGIVDLNEIIIFITLINKYLGYL